ncbi:hypothetical protein PIB30_047948 [Stylosanthes scabra]|uniref:Uncharacterized protein n=1 Tax=Stylosanthes scabra TaxID=79078 RepID=A0ABU6YFR3_9FABA|nr:hypothetical protein [Stylosanthes scabra]
MGEACKVWNVATRIETLCPFIMDRLKQCITYSLGVRCCGLCGAGYWQYGISNGYGREVRDFVSRAEKRQKFRGIEVRIQLFCSSQCYGRFGNKGIAKYSMGLM